MAYKRRILMQSDILRMALRLGHPPICDFCGGVLPMFVYAANRMSTGVKVPAWRWAACFPCAIAIETENWDSLKTRIRERLEILSGLTDEVILDEAIRMSLQAFFDDAIQEEDE